MKHLFKLFAVGGVLLVVLMIAAGNSYAQPKAFTLTVQNQKCNLGSTKDTVFFDIYILNTGAQSITLANCDFSFDYNGANFTTPAAAFVANTCDLAGYSVSLSLPSSTTIGVSLSPPTPGTSDDYAANGTGGTIPEISRTGNGSRIGTIRIRNATNRTGTLGLAWRGIAASNPKTIITEFDTSDVNATNTNNIGTNGTITNPSSNLALPVELTSFTASANRLSAQLKWSTATEQNNHGWDIERRSVETANAEWAKVGFVQGAGTSASPKQYSYTDASAAPGRYAYRLKQIDNDGSFKYSESTEVEVGLVAKVLTLSSNYPNPFNPTTTVEFTLAKDGKAVLNVYNELGQQVAELFNGEAQAGRIIQTHFDASRLSSGIYFSRLQADGKSLVKRMMLIK